MSSSLDSVAQRYFRRAWDRLPSNGSRTGLIEYDDRLELPTADLFAGERADVEGTLRELQALPEPNPGTLDWLDREAFRAHLELEHLALVQLRHWENNPVEPLETAVGSIFGLLMRRDVDRPETAEAIRKRLQAVPAFLEATRRRVERPIRMWLEAARPAARGSIEFLRGVVPDLTQRHPKLASGLEQAAAASLEAMAGYDRWLDAVADLPLPEDPAAGAQALEQIVRTGHGLSHSLDELDRIADREIERINRELAETASAIAPDRSWAQIMEEERERFASQPHDLMREYREATYGLRDRLVRDQVIDLPPGESCAVISTPAFLRSVIPSAAYSSPGPLDAIQRGIYYVSDPPDSLPREEYRANLGQHFGLESTCAHEAYPGHHVQLCWANRASSLSRQMAHHIIFMEGWTLYCEQMMLELGYLATPLWKLDCLHSQLWRAHRIQIDVRVHTGRMTVREAVATLQRELGFTELRAQTELNWYTQSPGTPMSYLLGKHETMALRKLYGATHPGCTLRDFHRWLLQFGSIPQRWLHSLVNCRSAAADR
jgi:hypothetical protein